MPASLYAIPTPFGGPPSESLPGPALQIIRDLRDFVAENAKTARAFLAAVGMPCPLRELRIEVLNDHFGDVEETAIMVTMSDMYPAKIERHVDSYVKTKR